MRSRAPALARSAVSRGRIACAFRRQGRVQLDTGAVRVRRRPRVDGRECGGRRGATGVLHARAGRDERAARERLPLHGDQGHRPGL
eukprot:3011537-Prymnesium_polylepis.2